MPVDFIARMQVSDSGFAFDPQTGCTYSLNRTALRVLGLLRAGRSREEAAEALVEEYGLPPADALRDVDDFIESLRELSRA